MKKIKLRIDTYLCGFVSAFFERLRLQKIPITGYELEFLILLDFGQKNYFKIALEKEYRLAMQPHQAISLYRMLFGLGLDDISADNARNIICDAIQQQFPTLKLSA